MFKKILIVLAVLMPTIVSAEVECDIIIKNRDFVSGKLERVGEGDECKFNLKADTKYKLRICNQDQQPAEFESNDLHLEKIIGAGRSALVIVRPQKAGAYEFEEEFSHNECEFVVK